MMIYGVIDHRSTLNLLTSVKLFNTLGEIEEKIILAKLTHLRTFYFNKK